MKLGHIQILVRLEASSWKIQLMSLVIMFTYVVSYYDIHVHACNSSYVGGVHG